MYLLSYTHTQKWHRQGFKLSSCPIFLRNVYCWSEKELTEWACHELFFNICISLCICIYCGMFGGQRTACGTESLFPLNYVIMWFLKMEFMSSGPASNFSPLSHLSSLVYRQFEQLYSDEISSVDVNSLLCISKLLSFHQTLRWIPTPTHTQSMVYMRYVVREPRVFFSPPRFWGPNSGCENWQQALLLTVPGSSWPALWLYLVGTQSYIYFRQLMPLTYKRKKDPPCITMMKTDEVRHAHAVQWGKYINIFIYILKLCIFLNFQFFTIKF